MNSKQCTVERYREENRHAQKGQIVFAGSSLMEQFPVEKLLRERGVDVTVYNRGVSGFVTMELLEVLDVCVTDLQPRRLFINIGTNDLTDPALSIADVMARYEDILTGIEAACPGVEVLLMAYYPINIDVAPDFMKPALRIRTNEKIALANAGVEKLAAHGRRRFINVNRGLTDEQGRLRAAYTTEGMHIREEGYRAIMDDLIPYVAEPAWG